MGYAETVMYDMGTFQVDDLYYEWTPKTMRSTRKLTRLFSTDAKSPIITSYDGQTLGSIVGSIAQSAGVITQGRRDPCCAIQVPFLNQHASSMHLLQELERRFGGLAKFQRSGTCPSRRAEPATVHGGTSIGTFTLS